jgi:hypothetical protein
MEFINLKPYLPKDFNLENIIYSTVQNEPGNKKSIFLYDKEPGKKIYIQSPELKNMVGLIKKNKYYEINLPLYGKKKSHVNSFIKFIKDLDNKIISDAKIYKNDWFDESNKNIRYRSLIKNIHHDYIDTIEYKAGMFENGIIKLKITDHTNITSNSEKISASELKMDHDIRTIFQIYAIWVSGDLFGLYLKPIKIDQKYKIIEQIDFIISESDNDTVYNTDIENLTEYSNINTDSEEKENIIFETIFKQTEPNNQIDNQIDNFFYNLKSDNLSETSDKSIKNLSDSISSINIQQITNNF